MSYILLLLCLFGLNLTICAYEIPEDIIERIIKLEASDRENKREISSLKMKIDTMEMDFLKREKQLLEEIEHLKDKPSDDSRVFNVNQENEEIQSEVQQQREEVDNSHIQKERRSLIVREAVETEVAFYATHSNHDILHLGQGQIIAFDQVVTNIGNAYNTHHGAFVAPVDGTYVFHVTLMGTLHNANDNHYIAYIDVDDVSYSQFYIVPYDQSSHMFVIELKSNSTVSVKNGRVDDGIVGNHYSAFSGFLLYQHFHQSPAIVGK